MRDLPKVEQKQMRGSEFYFNRISPVDLRINARGARTKTDMQVRMLSYQSRQEGMLV